MINYEKAFKDFMNTLIPLLKENGEYQYKMKLVKQDLGVCAKDMQLTLIKREE